MVASCTPPRSRRVRPSRFITLGVLLVAGVPRRTAAQHGLLVQGVADAELWKTDSGSVLLTRNHGRPGTLERIQLWGAAEIRHDLLAYAAVTAETGRARTEPGSEWYADQVGVRYTGSDAFVLDAGKMPHPVGTFASRRYSMRNPLIGMPDGYPVQYPIGVQLSGTRGRVDYRAAVVSLPVYHADYTPDPTPAARPAIGGGFTPSTGVRVGASATWGPYLSRAVPAALYNGRSWRSYTQRVGAIDARVDRGYFEFRGELAAARALVPGGAGAPTTTVRGLTYYGEAKYTLAPRVFVAGRFERNDYPYIQPSGTSGWVATATDVYNGEFGVGYRAGARTLFKASLRTDRWNVPPELRAALPNGAAFAFQCSRTFDVLDVAVGKRR